MDTSKLPGNGTASSSPLVAPAAVDTRETAVRAVLANYFDALYFASAERMAEVFHARGIYATADETPVLMYDRPTYLDVLRERRSPASRGEPRRDAIDHIEFAGNTTAWARVRCSIAPRDFVDFLTLIFDNGRWWIVAKVFHIKQPEAPTCPTSTLK